MIRFHKRNTVKSANAQITILTSVVRNPSHSAGRVSVTTLVSTVNKEGHRKVDCPLLRSKGMEKSSAMQILPESLSHGPGCITSHPQVSTHACGGKLGEGEAEALVGIFSRVGVPKRIHSDRGSQFTSEMTREVYRLLSVQQSRWEMASLKISTIPSRTS